MKGTIKRWFDYRRYGFIDVVHQEQDIFVHINSIKGFHIPEIGDTVEFEVLNSHKGPKAVDVEVISLSE
jgi:CspA family cold shock protein